MESNDLYLLLHSTSALRTWVANCHEQILDMGLTDQILELAKKMLDPKTLESTALFLGNFIIQIFH